MKLLSIVEVGGYPDFKPLYQNLGYEVYVEHSMRKALKRFKKQTPDIVVAEFNFQSDFRDRTSSLETLMSVIQKHPGIDTIIFYDQAFKHQFDRRKSRFPFSSTLAFPINETQLKTEILGLSQ